MLRPYTHRSPRNIPHKLISSFTVVAGKKALHETGITAPRTPTGEGVIKKDEQIEHYKANGDIGSGDGEKAGVAYRMKNGSMVNLPEDKE